LNIDSAEVWHVAMPLIEPWRTAYGADSAVHSILVRLSSGDTHAWGEACPLFAPTYSPESAVSVYETCRQFLLPQIVGRELDTADGLLQQLAIFKGNPFAKAAVETAWWALDSKLKGIPLWRLLGGTQPAIRCGDDFGVQDSIDQLLGRIERSVARGYPRVKLKLMRGWDVEVLQAVRSSFPRLVVHVDCNGGYDLHADWSTLAALDRFELAMIEQPLASDDLLEHADLQQRIATPICLDESVKSPKDFAVALKLGSCRAINVKPGRVGGLRNAVQIHDMARDAGITAWVGSMLESGVGVSICAALASMPNFTYPADLFPGRKLFLDDLVRGPLEIDRDCRVNLSTTDAGGADVDYDKLLTMSVTNATVAQRSGAP
jgi:O-succinylbenzoate synthase